jgi:hypothetical protein
MSYATEVKKQLCAVPAECPYCTAAELAGVMELSARSVGDALRCTTENAGIAERLMNDFKTAVGFLPELEQSGKLYHLTVRSSDELVNIADRLCLMCEPQLFNEIIPFNCCAASYVRGGFLGGGSVNDPQKSYHIEFGTKYDIAAEHLRMALERLKQRVKITRRKDGYVVYAKECETVAQILTAMGAGIGVMELYNIQIEKEMRNAVNRQVNCETANVDKVVRASVRQLDAIRKIEKTYGLDFLPDTLKEAAEIRREYPDESLKELAERLGIGKSGVNHRFARIIEIAEDL